MLTVLSPDLEDDADQLEGRWGIPVALEMLHERLITALDFFKLCQEAAHARATTPVLDLGSDRAPLGPSPRTSP
jgi:hypothetical protein